MAIRTKGRRRFDFNGRPFVWFVKDDVYLRIASGDKRFSVIFELVGKQPLLGVSSHGFPGIPDAIARPAWIIPPKFATQGSTPALVREVLEWCHDPDHEVVPYRGPPTSALQRMWDELASPGDT